MCKVLVTLTGRQPGEPASESLWARRVGDDLYEIRNVPFFADHLNYGDIVLCHEPDPDFIPEVVTVVTPSHGLTFRVAVPEEGWEEHWTGTVLPRLKAAGVQQSEGLGDGLFVINAPAGRIAEVVNELRHLDDEELIDLWDTNHPHQAAEEGPP